MADAAPASRANAANSATSHNSVSPGQMSARMPNRIATIPRSASIHHERVSKSLMASPWEYDSLLGGTNAGAVRRTKSYAAQHLLASDAARGNLHRAVLRAD